MGLVKPHAHIWSSHFLKHVKHLQNKKSKNESNIMITVAQLDLGYMKEEPALLQQGNHGLV